MKIQAKEQQQIWQKWPNFCENNEIWNFGQQIHKTLRKSQIFIILGHFCHFQLIKIKSPYIYNTLRNKIYGFTRLRDDKSWDLKIYRRCLSWPKGVPITIEIWFQVKNGPYWIFVNLIFLKYKQKKNNKYGKNDPIFAKIMKFEILDKKNI